MVAVLSRAPPQPRSADTSHSASPACRSCLQGKPSPLKSSFKLSYYTLLNLMRRAQEGAQQRDMDFVISNSFQQFQQERDRPKVWMWAPW